MNQLTHEQLDLIKRLQPLFIKKMGEWRWEDSFLWQGKMRYISEGWDLGLPHDILRIPQPIDWQNPERGLWGMINWKRFDIKRVSESGGVFLTGGDSGDGFVDPFTALLMALVQQEGV
jgi:hypothetical protein